MKELRFGTLPFDQWSGYWKAHADDQDVGGREYELCFRDLDRKLRRKYSNYPRDFYVRGDFFGDRSQDIEIVDPAVLTVSLLRDLQQFLLQDEKRLWRMRIPTYLDDQTVVVIYPSVIFVPQADQSNRDDDQALAVIRNKMYQAQRKSEK